MIERHDNFEIDIEINQSTKTCTVDIFKASEQAIIDTAQQLAWMAAGFRVSATESIQYAEASIDSHLSEEPGSGFNLSVKTIPLSAQEASCWHPLFSNAVIARGFPTPERTNDELGLEISIKIMASLGGARHAIEFQGGLMIKGYSAMFVPIRKCKGSIQWHLVRSMDDNRLPYWEASRQCPNRALLKDVDIQSIQTMRSFLGWWGEAETHLGARDASYGDLD